ncbi:hypothetical protein C6P46_004568 [Rhodotorula mucilaginosa]|uniref:RNase III domain-containing protein n=1 Tax=Rhodotorula mucilaginosa TaxID=5537 RepID=A0A9P7B6C8_RHOMI|nr:hypothetical protein C6P46_004568 [Rhodotorula mucilaginosa]
MEPHVQFRPPSSPPPPEWCAPYLVFRSDRLPPLSPVLDRTTLELALTHKSALPIPETLRQRISSNKTLSHLAWSYGFGTAIRATLDPSRARASVEHQKVVADAFEAYLAAALRPCGDDFRWELLRSYVRSLLDPECAEGLNDFAVELRTRRSAGEPKHVVLPVQPEASRKTAQHMPLPAELSKLGVPQASAAPPGNIAWVENPIHNGWIAKIIIGGRILASGRATKLLEARRRAEAHLLSRLESHPPTRDFLLTAPEASEDIE